MKILKIIVDELPLICGLCEICYPCDLWQEKTNEELHVRDENCPLELFHPAVMQQSEQLHIAQLIMGIEEFLEPLHPIRHSNSFLKLKAMYNCE